MKSSLSIFALIPALVACGSSAGSGPDGGGSTKSDAGADAGFTVHEISKDTFCSCPGQTALHLSSGSSGGTVEWSESFPAVTLGDNDRLRFYFDFSGPASWEVSMKDSGGNDAFATSGYFLPEADEWHCVYVDYSKKDNNYSVMLDGTGSGGEPTSATLPSTVAGVHVKYSGARSSAWLDSLVITRISGASEEVVFSESFDDPSVASSGQSAGTATVATPPASVLAPSYFCR